MIQNELEVPQDKIFCWSDSEITLWWIKKRPRDAYPVRGEQGGENQALRVSFLLYQYQREQRRHSQQGMFSGKS